MTLLLISIKNIIIPPIAKSFSMAISDHKAFNFPAGRIFISIFPAHDTLCNPARAAMVFFQKTGNNLSHK